MTESPEIRPGRALLRGLRKRCPRCGRGALVEGYYRLRPECEECGFRFQRAVGDHLGVIYITTAIQTAIFAALVLTVDPVHPWIARTLLAALALAVMLLNLPNRKGLAVAIDYLTGRDGDDPD